MMTNNKISTSKKMIISNTETEHHHSTSENCNSINMSITVKAYLQTADDSQKIRRFAVDQGESTSYEYLSTKITQVFPSIGRSDSFTLSYRDTEGDLVAFSNDTELADVLGQLNEGILKVYIHLTGKKCHNDELKYYKKVHYPRITCDGCKSRIAGPRFKCVVCPGYDLCKVCEEKGLHPEHEMIKIRKPQIGRSHMEGFSFRPGIWKLLSGGLRTKMSPKCNHMLRQRQKEQKKKSSTVDTQTKEGAPGNTNEGTDQQPECLKHVGDADILETLANPKLKRLVERKVTSKIPIDDRIDYRDSITGSNNHQRYCLHQRAEKCSIFQKPSRCCGARSPSLTNMSIQLKRFQRQQQIKRCRRSITRHARSHKCNNPSVLLKTAPLFDNALLRRIHQSEKVGMSRRNCSTMSKRGHRYVGLNMKPTPTSVSGSKRVKELPKTRTKGEKRSTIFGSKQFKRLHQSQRIGRCSRPNMTPRSTGGKKFKRSRQAQPVIQHTRCSTMTIPFRDQIISHNMIPKPTCVSGGRRFHQLQQMRQQKGRFSPMARTCPVIRPNQTCIFGSEQLRRFQQMHCPRKIAAQMAMFNAQKRHLSSNMSPGMKNSKGFDVDVDRHGMRKRFWMKQNRKDFGRENPCGRGPRCQCHKAQRKAQATAAK